MFARVLILLVMAALDLLLAGVPGEQAALHLFVGSQQDLILLLLFLCMRLQDRQDIHSLVCQPGHHPILQRHQEVHACLTHLREARLWQSSPDRPSTRLLFRLAALARSSCSHGCVHLGAWGLAGCLASAPGAWSVSPPLSSRSVARCRRDSHASTAPDYRVSGCCCHLRCRLQQNAAAAGWPRFWR